MKITSINNPKVAYWAKLKMKKYRDVEHLFIVESGAEEYKNLVLPDFDYDIFYHLAWDGVASFEKDNFEKQKNNIYISEQAIYLAQRYNCKKFIGAGTVAEYVFCENIMDFNQRQSPNDFYGAFKVSVHYIMEVLARKLEINFIWAVLPSTYGEGRDDNNIISYTIKSLLRGECPEYGNLEQLWDFVYVEDVAKALRYIGDLGSPGKIYGIGSGKYLKLKNYMQIVRDLINPELELGIGKLPEMSSKTKSSCVGIFDLVNDTGYQGDFTFEEGIGRTIDWFKQKM